MSPPKSPNRAGVACLTLFALPFAAVGVVTLGLALGHFLGLRPLTGNGDFAPTGQALMLLVFGLVFGGVGFGLMFGARYGARKAEEVHRRMAANPDEPWKWKEEWASGRIPSGAGSSALGLWIFGTVWSLISSPLLFVIPGEISKGNRVAAIGFLFPVIGALLLWAAVSATMRARRFGATFLEMAVPASPGRRLEARIESSSPLPPGAGVRVTVSAIRRHVSGSGKNRTVREDAVFQEEWTVPPERLAMGPAGTRIPISVPLPKTAPPSSPDFNSNDRILWRVAAGADIAGPDLALQFEIPVFAVPGSDPDAAEDPATGPFPEILPEELAPVQPGPGSGIGLDIAPDGGTRFAFEPLRNVGFAIGLFLFAAGLGTGVLLALRFGAPRPVVVVLALLDAAVVLGFLQQIAGKRTVTIAPGRIRIDGLLLGLGSREIQTAEVEAVELGIGMQSSGPTGRSVWHDVRLVRKSGLPVVAASSIRDKRHARWVAGEMARLAGVPFRG